MKIPSTSGETGGGEGETGGGGGEASNVHRTF